jgi:hypothetical protein
MTVKRLAVFGLAGRLRASTAGAVERKTDWTKRHYDMLRTGPLP